jgi:hypothetical protein
MNPQCTCRCSVLAADKYLRLSSGKLFNFNLILAIHIVLHLCFLGTRRGGEGGLWASFTVNTLGSSYSQTSRYTDRVILVRKRFKNAD